MSQKQWSCGGPAGPSLAEQEWSVHARLTITSPIGVIQGGDSGYGSEGSHQVLGGVPGARRATCSVTLSGAGPHYVTLTCADPSPPAPPPPPPPQPQPPPPPPPQFCARATQAVSFRDVASQTSSANLHNVLPVPPRHTKGRGSKSPSRSRNRPPRGKSGSGSGEGKKNPRTVHIDVYCTASESSSSDDDDGSGSSAQTVYETEKMKVVHTRANSDVLPHALQRQKRRVLSGASASEFPRCVMSDSSAYPSQRSSLASGFDRYSLPSESTIDSSCGGIYSDRSVGATSWKDTDLESTMRSDMNLGQSDSFEYANSTDKLRIKEKEKAWAGKTWRSPEAERRQVMKQKGTQCKDDEESETSDSSEDGTEMAWSFGRYEELAKKQGVTREGTVKRVPQNSVQKVSPKSSAVKLSKSGSLSDTEASPSHKYKKDAVRTMGQSVPIPPQRFEHLSKAEKFGAIVGSLRKPGHHVGPSKNPDCTCDTCRYFFEHDGYRNRTRSLGDKPEDSVFLNS